MFDGFGGCFEELLAFDVEMFHLLVDSLPVEGVGSHLIQKPLQTDFPFH